MKLQTKFILTLLGAVLFVQIGAQTTQQLLSRKALDNLSADNLALLQKREQAHADNIFQTVDLNVQSTILLGEMPKLNEIITNYNSIDGVLEYSIYDNRGVAVYSTDRQNV